MYIARKIIFGYILILFFYIEPSLEDDYDTSQPSEKSLASGLSGDLQNLSENVNEVIDDYSEDDSEDSGTPEEKRMNRMKKKYETVYKKDFENAQKVVDRQYSRYVKGTFESLDIMEYATEQLKRFWFTGQCRRNYDIKCPKGWIENGDMCTAPIGYKGVCNETKDFSGFGPKEKEDFAWRCQVEWPCINEKPIYDGFECPFEWAPISDSLCLAPKTYDGICSPIMDFSDFDVKKKALYEQKCKLIWRRVDEKGKMNEKMRKDKVEESKISGIIVNGMIRLI